MAKFKDFWNWYVRGEYHCDHCPYSWEERGCEDCDAGCYIKGELYDTCRLLPPFRAIIGKLRKNKYEYFREHEYDGCGEDYEKTLGCENKITELILSSLVDYDLIYPGAKGYNIIADKERVFRENASRIYYEYEEYAHPFTERETLGELWRKALKATWDASFGKLRPYFGVKNS